MVKIITDFTGCLQFRHCNELGGISFSITMLYSQIFPFVAYSLYGGKDDKQIIFFLVGSFAVWVVMNVIFFKTIDTSYISTFFGTMTAPQYTCKVFLNADIDSQRWDAFTTKRVDYTTAIHPQIKEWVKENIERWRSEKPDWFNVEKIPDEFLPSEVLAAEGGLKRRRSSVSLREIVGLDGEAIMSRTGGSAVHPSGDAVE